ncbi:MAG TPA: hypothetical protein VFG23_08440 [Polyangia bacterium]|nr:hypothetical protein [Polyangia bacterium]
MPDPFSQAPSTAPQHGWVDCAVPKAARRPLIEQAGPRVRDSYLDDSEDFRDWRDDWEWEGGGWASTSFWDWGKTFGTPVLWRLRRRLESAFRAQAEAPYEPQHLVLPPWLYSVIRRDRGWDS